MSTSLTSLQLRDKLSCIACQIRALSLFFHLDEELSHEDISGIDLFFEGVLRDMKEIDQQLSQQ